ncbi:MAG: dihydroorotate dehydrogenase electron transfer subunit [Patescibacteria group bacterium]
MPEMKIKNQNSKNPCLPAGRKITNQKSKIISNKKIKDNYFEIIVDALEIASSAYPGQFVNIRVAEGFEPLLRRPLSIHRVDGGRVILLYEALGKGTQILSQRKKGEYLDIIGPLGNGFRIANREPRLPAGEAGTTILVAGGMGTAPLIFLAEKLAEIKNQKSNIKNLVLIGAKSKNHILCEKEFKELGCEVKIATDDGSRGFKGYVSDLLIKTLSTVNCQLLTIYACGPAPMLKEIGHISQKYNIPAQVSLEAHMACGIGACMGCVIKTQNSKLKTQNDNAKLKMKNEFEYKRVCKEGPVFDASEVIW